MSALLQPCKTEFPCHVPGSMATSLVVSDVMLQGEGLLGSFNTLSEESHLVKDNCTLDFKTFEGK